LEDILKALDNVGTKPTFETVTKLATTGPYAYCRNSMYCAVLGIPGSLGLMLDSAWVAFGSNLALWMYLHFLVVPAEEKYLSKQLGDVYKKYCTNVKRWGFF
jgi:protein-S-isoprenylcysteine O-methyltransferase Ste14